MIKEFKEFLNRGNVVQIAVGLVIALYFQEIINAFVEAIVNPLVALIFGKPDFASVGFTISDTFFPVGLILTAVIIFILVAFILFLIVKAYERSRKEEGAGPTEAELLTEIRDLLRDRRN